MHDPCAKLSQIEKLGQALKTKCPGWKITDRKEENDPRTGDHIRQICQSDVAGRLVYAIVFIPAATYTAFSPDFKALGDQSIGDHFLFKRDDVTRSQIQVSQLDRTHEEYRAVAAILGDEPHFYKRESQFYIGTARHVLVIREYVGMRAASALELIGPLADD